jgi:lysozyme family protein
MPRNPSFLWAVERTLEAEGVFSDDRLDPGGATIYGVAKNRHPVYFELVYSAVQEGDKNLAMLRAKEFYFDKFWVPQRCHEMASKYVAAEIFDTSVNVGPYWAGKIAQTACNTLGHSLGVNLALDGKIGNKTITVLDKLSYRYEVQLLQSLNLFQGIRYYNLFKRDPKRFGHFFRGWMHRLKVPGELI